MIIRDVRITPIAFRDPPLLNVTGVHEPYATRCIVEIETASGRVGINETYGDTSTTADLATIAPALAGLNIYDLGGLAAVVRSRIGQAARSEYEMAPGTLSKTAFARCFAAFEVACLDLQGQRCGRPVCDLLGGKYRDAVPYSAYLFFRFAGHRDQATAAGDEWGEVLTPEALLREAKTMVALHGFRSLKLKAGVLRPADEIATMRLLRQEFPGHPLRMDPNYGWTVETAVKVADELRGVLEYLEDPAKGAAAMRRIAAAIDVPIASNMAVTAFEDLPAVVTENSIRIILSDHHYWGGLRATRELGRICAVWGLGISMHSNSHLGISLMAMTHVAASVPNLSYDCDTHYPWQVDDVIEGGRLRFENGCIRVPTEPGLGVRLDYARLRELHENYKNFIRGDRDDIAEMRKYRPGWTGTLPRY
jgi:glucarate dehydratase